jgi:hypothetical protein
VISNKAFKIQLSRAIETYFFIVKTNIFPIDLKISIKLLQIENFQLRALGKLHWHENE